MADITQMPPSTPTAPPALRARERGGCLTAFLLASATINFLAAWAYFLAVVPEWRALPIWALPTLSALSFIHYVCAIALWNWRRWGLYGYVLSALTGLPVGLILGLPIANMIPGLVGLAILGLLVRRVWDQME